MTVAPYKVINTDHWVSSKERASRMVTSLVRIAFMTKSREGLQGTKQISEIPTHPKKSKFLAKGINLEEGEVK